MAVVTGDFLAAVLTDFRALWTDAFLAALGPTFYPRFAMEVPSTTLTETYNWLGAVPVMREWIDQRQLGGLASYNYSLTNKHYETSLEVDRDTFEDDQLGLISPRIRQLGMEVPRFIENTAVNALVNGAVSGNNSYDGVTFYNASHIIGNPAQAAQTNLFSFTGYDTIAHMQADFIGVKAQMRNVLDGEGRPMNTLMDFCLIPPAAEFMFGILLNSAFFPVGSVGSGENVLRGQADVGVSPYVTVSTWHGLATKYPVKPLIFQNRKPPEFASVTDPNSINVFNTRKFLYGVDTRFAIGYGLWEMAIKVA